MKKIIILLTIFSLIVGCSKEDNQAIEEEQGKVIDGGTITKFKIVNQSIENLTEEKYDSIIYKVIFNKSKIENIGIESENE